MDIFFLSFNESNREKNWRILKTRFPSSQRIHGVRGPALAHLICAERSKTPYFFVVNGDNEVSEDFHFQLPEPLIPAVYAYRSLNPVNQLVYGFGAVKLFWKSPALFRLSKEADVSTSLNIPYRIMPQTASVTRFNASPLEAWRGAFRECVKLAARRIPGQKDKETKKRLKVWCEKGEERPFGGDSILGARRGRAYGLKHRQNPTALKRINDFDWLKARFLESKSRSRMDNKFL